MPSGVFCARRLAGNDKHKAMTQKSGKKELSFMSGEFFLAVKKSVGVPRRLS